MSTLDERPGVRDQIATAHRAWKAAGTPTVAGSPDHLAEVGRLTCTLFVGDPAEGRPGWAVRSEDDSWPPLHGEVARTVLHYGPTVSIPNGEGDPECINANLAQQVITTPDGEDRFTYLDLGRVDTVSVGAIRQLAALLLGAADALDGAL